MNSEHEIEELDIDPPIVGADEVLSLLESSIASWQRQIRCQGKEIDRLQKENRLLKDEIARRPKTLIALLCDRWVKFCNDQGWTK